MASVQVPAGGVVWPDNIVELQTDPCVVRIDVGAARGGNLSGCRSPPGCAARSLIGFMADVMTAVCHSRDMDTVAECGQPLHQTPVISTFVIFAPYCLI